MGLRIIAGLLGILVAQSAGADSVIVKFKDGVSTRSFQSESVSELLPINGSLNLHEIKLVESRVERSETDKETILKGLRRRSDVVYAQWDHPITMRSMPNDPSFGEQWSFGAKEDFGIEAVPAWAAFKTGGMDMGGNEIVVAVVDSGVDRSHKDLVDNVWTNTAEIAGNGIDDDENGYVDDTQGGNAYNNTGVLKSSTHGTHVAGIIGAKGNNESHVSGVNWNVRLMDINGSTGRTSIALRAYTYVLTQKKLWLETEGAKGANVVVTNSSFGVDGGDCESENYAAWNDIYNEMGKYGILSAAATANRSWDIDEKGDVPTGCSSPYIIAVTNNNNRGTLNSAGWGATSIDLAAPGTQILSTVPGDGVRKLSGTSMATPHVAGAVAYLHSVGQLEFSEFNLLNPSEGALAIKKILMETVTPNAEFEGKLVSPGILNLHMAAQKMYDWE